MRTRSNLVPHLRAGGLILILAVLMVEAYLVYVFVALAMSVPTSWHGLLGG